MPDVLRLVLYYVLFAFWLLLTARIVVELVHAFARKWRPVGQSAVALEAIFTMTDPPVKLLRRVIPTVRIGGVGAGPLDYGSPPGSVHTYGRCQAGVSPSHPVCRRGLHEVIRCR